MVERKQEENVLEVVEGSERVVVGNVLEGAMKRLV